MSYRRARAFQTHEGSRITLEPGIELVAKGLSYQVAAEVCDVLNPSYVCRSVSPLAMTLATALGRLTSSLWEAPSHIEIRETKGSRRARD